MQPASYNLVIKENSDFSQVFTLNDPNTGAPLNLTGYEAYSQVRISYSDATPLITFSTAIDGINGKITISATKSQLSGLSVSNAIAQAIWDLMIKDTNNITTCIIQGGVTLIPAVTR